MRRTALLLLACVLAFGPLGCVTRRFVITSNPPAATVFRDGQPIGVTPVEQPFTYHGRYRFRIVKDGYEPLDLEPELVAPWYQVPGIDFIAENLYPFTLRDVQGIHAELRQLQPVPAEVLRARGEELRQRGRSMIPPDFPNLPHAQPVPGGLPAPMVEPPLAVTSSSSPEPPSP